MFAVRPFVSSLPCTGRGLLRFGKGGSAATVFSLISNGGKTWESGTSNSATSYMWVVALRHPILSHRAFTKRKNKAAQTT